MVKIRTSKRRGKETIETGKKKQSKVKQPAKIVSESDEDGSSVGSDGELEFTNESDGSLPGDDFDDSELNTNGNGNNDSDDENTDGDDENSDDSDDENPGDNESEEKKPEDSLADENSEGDEDSEMEPEEHKKSLQKLKETDPDFYEFLEQNDKNLLDFDLDTSDEEETKEDDADETSTHVPGELHVDSDESDYEPEDGSGKVSTNKVTFKMVTEWQNDLQTEEKMKLATIANAIRAFRAAMQRITLDPEDKKDNNEYIIEGSSVFNAVVQMCVLYLQPALKKFLKLEITGKDPQKSKHFTKVKTHLIDYLTYMMKLLGGVTSPNILSVLLKHLHQMSPFVACFSGISKQLLKRLIILWSTSEETVRVLAFLCILRITRNLQTSLLNGVLKSMYMTFIKNCKFVSPTTWPGIHFMRRSLVEMFSLDLNVSYHHVFLYIRQLAIHLRNAIVVKKIESRQAVYNWQFINSMHLWSELLGATCNKPQLQPLVYPLVMIITNTIKLMPTPQYFPLRFHCVEIMIQLSKDTGTFMPVLPFILEILTNLDFTKKSKKVSMKPLDFSCILRLSVSQLGETGFKDTVIDKVYGTLLHYLANESSSIAFPDLVILATIQLKKFTKTCTFSNYTRKMRQLLEKIEENSKFIETERRKLIFSLTDSRLISAWETTLRNKGTPLSLFYDNWFTLNRTQKKKKISRNDELAERLPVINKRSKLSEKTVENDGPVELFPSDSEDEQEIKLGPEEDDDAVIPEKKKKKKVKKSKVKTSVAPLEDTEISVADAGDDVKDFNAKDW